MKPLLLETARSHAVHAVHAFVHAGGNYEISSPGIYTLRSGEVAPVTGQPVCLVSDLDGTMVGQGAATCSWDVGSARSLIGSASDVFSGAPGLFGWHRGGLWRFTLF